MNPVVLYIFSVMCPISELLRHTFHVCQIVFFGIDNIHAMRDSFARLRDYLDTHGTASSDGMSSFLVSPQNKVFDVCYMLNLFLEPF